MGRKREGRSTRGRGARKQGRRNKKGGERRAYSPPPKHRPASHKQINTDHDHILPFLYLMLLYIFYHLSPSPLSHGSLFDGPDDGSCRCDSRQMAKASGVPNVGMVSLGDDLGQLYSVPIL